MPDLAELEKHLWDAADELRERFRATASSIKSSNGMALVDLVCASLRSCPGVLSK